MNERSMTDGRPIPSNALPTPMLVAPICLRLSDGAVPRHSRTWHQSPGGVLPGVWLSELGHRTGDAPRSNHLDVRKAAATLEDASILFEQQLRR
jgi:hypothetical protein